jgi:hypothetical protein
MQFKNLWLLIKLVFSERIRAFCALYVVKSAVIMGLLNTDTGLILCLKWVFQNW